MLSEHVIAAEAEALLSRRRRRSRFEPLRQNGEPVWIGDAYRIQRMYSDLLCGAGGAVRGYKIGLTEGPVQARFGITEPVVGDIHERWVLTDGASVTLRDYVHLGVECEIALVVGRKSTGDDSPFRWGDIARVHAAFELIDNRGASLDQADAGSIIADNAWNAAVVLGRGCNVAQWSAAERPGGMLLRDGKPIGHSPEDLIMGGPLAALNWLATHLQRQGRRLRAGDIVMTGSLIGPVFPVGAETLEFAAQGLANVTLTIDNR